MVLNEGNRAVSDFVDSRQVISAASPFDHGVYARSYQPTNVSGEQINFSTANKQSAVSSKVFLRSQDCASTMDDVTLTDSYALRETKICTLNDTLAREASFKSHQTLVPPYDGSSRSRVFLPLDSECTSLGSLSARNAVCSGNSVRNCVHINNGIVHGLPSTDVRDIQQTMNPIKKNGFSNLLEGRQVENKDLSSVRTSRTQSMKMSMKDFHQNNGLFFLLVNVKLYSFYVLLLVLYTCNAILFYILAYLIVSGFLLYLLVICHFLDLYAFYEQNFPVF